MRRDDHDQEQLEERKTVQTSSKISNGFKTPAEIRLAAQALSQKMRLSQTLARAETRNAAQASSQSVSDAPEEAKEKAEVIQTVRDLTKRKRPNLSVQAEIKLAAQALSQKMRLSQNQKRTEIGLSVPAPSQIMSEAETPQQAQLSRMHIPLSIRVSDFSEEPEELAEVKLSDRDLIKRKSPNFLDTLHAEVKPAEQTLSQSQERDQIGQCSPVSYQIMTVDIASELAQVSRSASFFFETISVSDSSDEPQEQTKDEQSTRALNKRKMNKLLSPVQAEVIFAAQVLSQSQERDQIGQCSPASYQIMTVDIASEQGQVSRVASFFSETISVSDSSDEPQEQTKEEQSTRALIKRKMSKLSSPVEAELKLWDQVLSQSQERDKIGECSPASYQIMAVDIASEQGQVSRAASYLSETISVSDSSMDPQQQTKDEQSTRALIKRKMSNPSSPVQAELNLRDQVLSQSQERDQIGQCSPASYQIMTVDIASEQAQVSRAASLLSETISVSDSSIDPQQQTKDEQSARALNKRKIPKLSSPVQTEVKLAAQALSQKMRLSQKKRLFQTKERAEIELAAIASSEMMIGAENPDQCQESRTARFLSQTMSVSESPEEAQALLLRISMDDASEHSDVEQSAGALNNQIKLAAQALSQKMRLSQYQKAEEKLAAQILLEENSEDDAFKQAEDKQLTCASSKRSKMKSHTTKRSHSKLSKSTKPVRNAEENVGNEEHYEHICGTMDHIQNLWIKLEPWDLQTSEQ